MYQRSFKLVCQNCSWYVILRRNGGMISMFLNNFNSCPKCKCEDLVTLKPSIKETINPLEQFKKFYYLIAKNRK
ncbi:hypothetical protein SAMN00017405_2107 [Desulfonispora thiosulfatigenes DSM 11270]|uniref:Uncharacterized protein n=1 Tax=Desulfonispora thiosulfatigenes DSM 11270 TaxID=656914 RepID=A0A1W1VHH1_DESTI|nr:hypothetical protein [Desulfonispora thiosulfatigenes]SMB92819.1 hypothetical protein SAMN00017405_2107 [Desulfonispora thiosulfatigenes DSM 11270]